MRKNGVFSFRKTSYSSKRSYASSTETILLIRNLVRTGLRRQFKLQLTNISDPFIVIVNPLSNFVVAGRLHVLKRKDKKKKARKSDTNVINVKFGCLEENAFTSTAQPVKCSKCPSVMSNLEDVFNKRNNMASNFYHFRNLA